MGPLHHLTTRIGRTGCWLLVGLLSLTRAALGQSPEGATYWSHIQPLVARHCAACHRPGGVGPFSLLAYEDVAKRAKFVAKVTEIRYMPPFPADRAFQHYQNERGLSAEEIAVIQQWWQAGAPEGKRPKKQGKADENRALIPERKPDLVLRMRQPYPIKGDGQEDFRYFHLPTGLKEDALVETIEFVPGNRRLLHHSRIMVDSTGTMAGIDGLSETDPRLATFQRTPLADEFLYGWVPGNDRVSFPAGTAKRIRAGSDLLVNIHYAPSAKAEEDQSEVRLYFAKTPVTREVKTLTLTENHISNQPFLLKAETKPTFYISYGPIQQGMDLISVLPHMHLLGQTFKAVAVTPEGDVVNLVKIDAWDYKWQMTYRFAEALHLPKGSIILVEASYDNTSENPENPFRPAKDVGYGWNSTNEMMNLVLYYTPR